MEGRDHDCPGRRNIIELFAAFDMESANGTHRCLVLELAASDVATLIQCAPYTFLDRLYLFRQCVEAVEYLHSLGISHGGKHIHVLRPQFCLEYAKINIVPLQTSTWPISSPRYRTCRICKNTTLFANFFSTPDVK